MHEGGFFLSVDGVSSKKLKDTEQEAEYLKSSISCITNAKVPRQPV